MLLLDEVEKAHPDVFNILLQVMDHGTLTDTNGKQADFRSAILLMTSNLGAREMAARAVGFGDLRRMAKAWAKKPSKGPSAPSSATGSTAACSSTRSRPR